MTTPQTTQTQDATSWLNNFSINVATANGTGSQTSNIALFRAMFRMGIAVTGKNLFPSNIQGLPTWYRLRVNNNGYTSFRRDYQVLVAMNKATYHRDFDGLAPGGIAFYDDSLPVQETREDITYIAMPVRQLVKQVKVAPKLRGYIANMVYVGVLVEALGIEMDEIRAALMTHFKGKEKAVALNMEMIEIARDWAATHCSDLSCPYTVERIEGGNANKILLDGNEAAGLGSVYGGITVCAWYPITPSTSLVDGLNKYLPELRTEADSGKATYAVIQAEDELAAIGTVIGAGWAGARAMTATSGPGVSLMAEFAGLAYFAEIPGVIWNIQRVGPSTGMPTRTSQGDLFFTHFLGHGDTTQIVLLPSSPAECFEMAWRSFDIADRFQTPVFVLSDLDLGMNLWSSDELVYPDEEIDRGKIMTAEQLTELAGNWGRYRDVDGDGIPFRTLPGTEHPRAGYFTRGTGHDEFANYSEDSEVWEANLERLQRKFNTARNVMPAPVLTRREGATFGVISMGSNDPAMHEALDLLAAEGIVADYLRVRALPAHDDIHNFVQEFDHVFVVENNFDGQLYKILLLDRPEASQRLNSVARLNGLPLEATWIADQLRTGIASKH